MRLAATKSKGKAKADDGKEKIVRRFVSYILENEVEY